MQWWHIVVILLDSYLLLALGPWIALQTIVWLMSRAGHLLAAGGERLRELRQAEQEQRRSWPQEPRPGRYERLDRLALVSLASLQAALAEAERLWPLLANYNFPTLRLVDVFSLRSWWILPNALGAWRNARAFGRLLEQGDQVLDVLREQQQAVKDIPEQVRIALDEARTGIQRLAAALEVEESSGTLGLEATRRELGEREKVVEQALEILSGATVEELPTVIWGIDEMLPAVRSTLIDTEQLLVRLATERDKAQSLIDRVRSSLQLAEKRWEELKARGATEPELSRTLAELKMGLEKAVMVSRGRTVEAYQQVVAQAETIDAQIEALLRKLDALDELMIKSQEAVKGDVLALAQAQAMCDEIGRQEPLLELDRSLALIEKASQAYLEAERQRGLGTFQGYEASLGQAKAAMMCLTEAQAGLANLPERVLWVREGLSRLTSEAIREWRKRADRVQEQLRIYKKHWDAGLAGDVAEVISRLEQIEVDLERLPPNIRYRRRFRQSEVDEAAEIVSHACQEMEEVQKLVDALEAELQRLQSLHAELEKALERLRREDIPAMEQLSSKMLPELRQRFDAFLRAFQNQVASLSDPSQTDYEQSTKQWLPAIYRELEELKEEHERSVREYGQAFKEALRRLERQWTRLSKLNPQDLPGPEEQIDRLAKDIEDWRADAQRYKDNPFLLRDIVGRRAAALEQRIEVAGQQIVEGRRLLDLLERDYGRHAQAVQRLRQSLDTMRRKSRWPQIVWDTGEVERVWEKANDWERRSRAARDLVSACEHLRQAVSAVQQAEQLFVRVERQVGRALRDLDREFDDVTEALTRTKRRIEELRRRGASDELMTREAQIVAAERAIQMAEASTTFEDALRHLQAARDALAF